jgi:ATP synthase protein I
MNEPKSKPEKSGQDSFSAQVGAKATRRLRAQRHKPSSVWTGFAFFGLIGWSWCARSSARRSIVADRHHRANAHGRSCARRRAVLGCFNAWRWLDKGIANQTEQTMTNMSDASPRVRRWFWLPHVL